jgi:peptide/nickel transport system permease protein
MAEFIKSYTCHNLLAFAFLAAGAYLLLRASRQQYWVSAWRQLRANKLAMISLFIIVCYGIIGTLDSIGWRDWVLGADGRQTYDKEGEAIYEPVGFSLLDRLFTRLKDNIETTYSAPLATHQYTKEAIEMPDGGTVRGYPKLKYPRQHLLGTGRVGGDILFKALKGVRTALIIGGLTTLIAIPFAILFGAVAGFFGGWVDDVIVYIYSTLASIPGILLIVAFILLFERGLFQLCIIMGITSWTGLCRLLRAETLKLRELDYVEAAEAVGVSRAKILLRHIIPNLMHIVLISFILRFSGLVMSEAVLSYIGVGVGPETGSWGNMINAARFEFGREPMVWWNLLASFIFMFGLVLPVNIFGDAARDALDPRLRTR